MVTGIKRCSLIIIILLLLLPNSISATDHAFVIKTFESQTILHSSTTILSNPKQIRLDFFFFFPEIVAHGNYFVIRMEESDLNRMEPGQPVIPVNLTIFEFPFGTHILDVSYTSSTPWVYNLTQPLAIGGQPGFDTQEKKQWFQPTVVMTASDSFPNDWISYQTGGGLSNDHHKTYFILRIYPVRYFPIDSQIRFIPYITVNVSYQEPIDQVLNNKTIYDMLIICPASFSKYLQPLVNHKNNFGIKTKLVDLDQVYHRMFWNGRDNAEKIKYFIKNALDQWGIKYVLFVGGVKGQSLQWNVPVRYSHVVPPTEQEYAEPSFLCDLYFADIYNGQGEFSNWDTNNNAIFAEWNETYKDNMDLYPDVYLGRLPCRSIKEVKIMVDKIITYENTDCKNTHWFNRIVLVGGDSYVESAHINEGELICEEALKKMDGFTPQRVYATHDDINRKTVNSAMNGGAGFAYFCGHGSDVSWNTHFFPADESNWCTGYTVLDMIFLRNKNKLPITVVGGCHNGQFDISVLKSIKKGLEKKGWRYFLPNSRFWYDGWATNCWAWWLTSKSKGGAIATIANTGLGTHGDGDVDYNSIPDYLEVLDGWLELRFLELYGTDHQDILGKNHGQTITEYLHRFLGNEAKMDTKMVQQWELFGDPTLKIGGYSPD